MMFEAGAVTAIKSVACFDENTYEQVSRTVYVSNTGVDKYLKILESVLSRVVGSRRHVVR